MRPAESKRRPYILFLYFDPSLPRMVSEVLNLEGYAVVEVTTMAQAVAALRWLPGNGIVLFDNLQLHVEGQQFLEMLRHEPDFRARLRTICMAAEVNCTRARQEYGDVLDDYLLMPFTVTQLLNVLERSDW
jgi:CheY-like chemotaxis protein